jgi:hypothetical protein
MAIFSKIKGKKAYSYSQVSLTLPLVAKYGKIIKKGAQQEVLTQVVGHALN